MGGRGWCSISVASSQTSDDADLDYQLVMAVSSVLCVILQIPQTLAASRFTVDREFLRQRFILPAFVCLCLKEDIVRESEYALQTPRL